jgi:hypothetical protein
VLWRILRVAARIRRLIAIVVLASGLALRRRSLGWPVESGRSGLVAVLEGLAEQPSAALLEPAPVALAAPRLGPLVEDQAALAASPQLTVAVTCVEPWRPHRVEHAADAELHCRAFDRVGEGR